MLKKYLNNSNYEIAISLSSKYITYNKRKMMDVNVEVIDTVQGGSVYHDNFATTYRSIKDFKNENFKNVKNVSIFRVQKN